MARANMNKRENFMTNTYYRSIKINVNIVKQDLLNKKKQF